VELVKDVSISSRSKERSEEVDGKHRQLLAETNIVVVGISLDSSNGHLILWRYSGSGFFTVKLDIPIDGKASYESVMKRFSDVFSGLKKKPIATSTGEAWADDLKKKWWKKTLQLDKQVENILCDIEEHWFAATKLLLLPATSDEYEGEDAAKQAALALANIQAVYGDEAPEDALMEAFDYLNLGTQESLWIFGETTRLSIARREIWYSYWTLSWSIFRSNLFPYCAK